MSIVVSGAIFIDIKGFPNSKYIPDGRNAEWGDGIRNGVCSERRVGGKCQKLCHILIEYHAVHAAIIRIVLRHMDFRQACAIYESSTGKTGHRGGNFDGL